MLSAVPGARSLRPQGLALDEVRQILFFSDVEDHVVYMVDLLNASAVAEVVVGIQGMPGDFGDTPYKRPALQALLRHPDGLALDPIAQRLFVGDSTSAVRVVDLESGVLTLALVRPGFQHDSGNHGPIGLALTPSTVPGFRVDSIHHNPLLGGAHQFGNYFYFKSDVGYAGGYRNATGVLRSRHYRRGVMIWVGYIRFFGERYGVGPTRQSYPELDNTGIRYPPPVSEQGQFEINDTILVPGLLGPEEEARQMIYLAEGHSYTVRSADIAAPANSTCGDQNVTLLDPSLWELVPSDVGGPWTS